MPKSIVLPDPDATTTVGVTLTFTRTGSGAAGIEVRYDVPTDTLGTFVTNASALTAGARTNLQAIHAEVIALFKAARGYT